jgi:hypothetical protein
MRARTVVERLSQHVVTDHGCWIGPWKPESNGYVRIWLRPCDRKAGAGEYELVHRRSYETFVGPIPPAHEVDHICLNRACFNPTHLVAVLGHQNILRSAAPSGVNSRKTRCIRGHPFTPDNTRIIIERNGDPGRSCRKCERVYERETRGRYQADKNRRRRERRAQNRPSAEYITEVRRKAARARWDHVATLPDK